MLNKLDLLPEDEADRRCKEIVRRLRWKGPVYRISGLARQGTEALCRDVMKRLEELGYQPSEAPSESGLLAGGHFLDAGVPGGSCAGTPCCDG